MLCFGSSGFCCWRRFLGPRWVFACCRTWNCRLCRPVMSRNLCHMGRIDRHFRRYFVHFSYSLVVWDSFGHFRWGWVAHLQAYFATNTHYQCAIPWYLHHVSCWQRTQNRSGLETEKSFWPVQLAILGPWSSQRELLKNLDRVPYTSPSSNPWLTSATETAHFP